MRVAEVYVAQRDLASAKQSLRRALEVAPNYFPAQTQLFALNLADQGYREAMALAKDVQRSQPTTGTGLGMEGQLLEAQKNFAGAIAAYRGSLARSASAPAAIGLHRSLAASGDLSGAQRHEREWRERNPNDVQFISYVAGTASQAKDWARAEDLYRLVLRLTPNNLEASNNLAWALMKQKKSGAVELAARAVQLAPSDAGVLDTYANALLSEGKVAEGLKNAEEALRINTTLNEARLTVARAALMAGDKARAKKELESLLYLGDKFPEQTEVADLLRTLP
jgi:tetratricopeptide (TPR) repeat protein